jgi:glycosyltransferase involved in cell wall biosynthesis
MSKPLSTRNTPTTAHAANGSFLIANSETYEWLVGKTRLMDRQKKVEAVLRSVGKAASFAINFHSGRFADGAIENLALEIGAQLPDLLAQDGGIPPPIARKKSHRRVLHVTTSAVEIGGHTRMIYHWVRNDKSSSHSIMLIHQGNLPIPSWLSEAVQISGGTVTAFQKENNLCNKALLLRQIARQSADLVVLHHFGFDVVPTVAFAAHECPPVAVLNHADHVFWMGSSVADMVINLRTVGAEYTMERRYVPCNHVLPIPLFDHCVENSRADARKALGIREDQIVLLSIGRAEKYRPYGDYSFVATANKILERESCVHLYVVGESASGIAPYLRCAIHERLHFVGIIEDPSQYRAAADVYLESFPFGSQTALLEAALSGLPVVPAYAPLHPLLVANDDSLIDFLHNPYNEQDYIERVLLMIRCPVQRVTLGEILRKQLLVDHVGEGWQKCLDAMYQKMDLLKHRPRPIPVSSCCMTDADINLSLWHAVADGRTYTTGGTGDGMDAVLRHSAFVAKEAGNYAKARLLSWRAVWYVPYQLASWRLLGVSLLGRSGRSIRRLLYISNKRVNKCLFRW